MPGLPESDAKLAGILRELIDREPSFHRAEHDTFVVQMTAEDFWEVGAPGSQSSRAFVLDTLG